MPGQWSAMDSQPSTSHLCKRHSGFTLIEVLLAVIIVGVLVAVAFPSYQQSVRKGRRAEALAALAAVQNAQERWRSNHAEYGNLDPAPNSNTLPNIASTTPSRFYEITVSSPSSTGYTASATAQGSQVADTDCKLMAVRMDRGSLSYGSGSSALVWPDPNRCWAR